MLHDATATVVAQLVQGVEDRHPEPHRSIDRLHHLPQPFAPWPFHLPVKTLVPQASRQQRVVSELTGHCPLHRSAEALLQGVLLLLKG